MKSRSEIWFALLAEVGSACSVSTTFDRQTAERRVEAEGDSFFTVTLPRFEKDLLWSLEGRCIPNAAFVGFKRRVIRDPETHGKYHGVPQFLGGFMDLLFTSSVSVLDVETGKWHEELSPFPHLRHVDPTDLDPRVTMALKGLRQLCLLFSKEKSLCDQSKIDQAIEGYVETDDQVVLPLAMSEEPPSLRVVFSHTPREYFH